MDKVFENLAQYLYSQSVLWKLITDAITHRRLEVISNRVKPQTGGNWTEQMLKKLQQVVQADRVSQEIDGYFEDIRNALNDCEVSGKCCELQCNQPT